MRSNIYINNIIDEFASIRESDTQLSTIAIRKRDQTQEKARKFEKIASIIRFFQDRCPYCYINDISDDNHLLYRCRQVECQEFKAYYVEYRNNFRKFKTIRNLSACTRCLLPPSLCKRWIPSSTSAKWAITNEDCSYPDVILSIFVIGFYFQADISDLAVDYARDLSIYRITQDRGLDEITYLSEIYSWGEIESIRLLEYFYRASKEIFAIRYIDIDRYELE